MEELIFIKDGARLALSKYRAGACVPRKGDYVAMRDRDIALAGFVSKVEWYFSISNEGPVITVYLED
jgi:hypothetical protein